jgi:molybdopterin adenylyltransferase
MSSQPHPDDPNGQNPCVSCGVITVSDTRTPETDTSGQRIQALLTEAGHQVIAYHLVKDDPQQIQALVKALVSPSVRPSVNSSCNSSGTNKDSSEGSSPSPISKTQAIIVNGGTGIAWRDTTYDAIVALLEKELPGFGEIFRSLSFADIGSRAIASRATAGVYQQVLIFSLPGSTPAVQLAMERLILPELRHLVKLLQPTASSQHPSQHT